MTLSIPNTLPPVPAAEPHAAAPVATASEQTKASSTASPAKMNESTRVHELKMQGQTPSEISVELSLPPATVKTDLFIGIPKMVGAGVAGSVSVNA